MAERNIKIISGARIHSKYGSQPKNLMSRKKNYLIMKKTSLIFGILAMERIRAAARGSYLMNVSNKPYIFKNSTFNL
jgi:hypothetical protein